ncbi:ankyrin repeat domain-containing protein [Pontibacter mangrovi]|uniref:Ankyrin repeat domain-containing protein n=1 Tax=Pontibacter mangrovi TaxID=2589816 RepID=A0A501W1D6_9BACT|nr:ankyrin repeat domain-containing protein [Pontibacter mangrovi]TPE42405.1 ankyrin repeat domain-containing protein [Pontibacter mangrovi]
METQKVNIRKSLYYILFVLIFLPACAQSDQNTAADTGAEVPEIDMQAAVIAGNLDVVKQHIEAGTDIDKTEPMSGSTPLITAITFGKTDIAKALIDAGADLSIKNNDGSTALHVAAFFCRVELVQMLLDANADKTLRNNFGATARESVTGDFSQMKPVYGMMQEQLGPLGLQLDMEELEKTRPVIAMMLQ